MIQTESNLKVSDNSGGVRVRCIHINGPTGIKSASVGDVIVVSVKECLPNSKVKKGDIHFAVIVRTIKPKNRSDNFNVRFDDNAVVLIDKKTFDPIGTRVMGPVSREVRMVSPKITSLAPEVF